MFKEVQQPSRQTVDAQAARNENDHRKALQMTATLRASLSFLLAVVMSLTVGLTLAEPAEAKIPETPNNPLGTISGPVPPDTQDLVFWRSEPGRGADRGGDVFVVDASTVNSATFGYLTGLGTTYGAVGFEDAVRLCNQESEACRAQVATNVTQLQEELDSALSVAMANCSAASQGRTLNAISTPNRVRLASVGAGITVLFPFLTAGNFVDTSSAPGKVLAAATVAGGIILSGLASEFVNVAGQRYISGETIVTWNLGFNAIRSLAATIGARILTQPECDQVAQDIELGAVVPQGRGQQDIRQYFGAR